MTEDVKPSELRLLEAVAREEEADFRPEREEKTDASGGASWGDERSIRAEFLYDLCTEAVAPKVSARGLRIRGAKVCGELNLEAADIPFPLAFRDCYFERPVTLELARVPSLRFSGSYVPSMNGDQIAVLGNVELTHGFAAEGVRLAGAQIGGLLSCRGGSFTNPGGSALSADGATFTGSVFLDQGFAAEGEVRLPGTQIGGLLSCRGGSFTNPGGSALSAGGARIAGNALLDEGFAAEGEVGLPGAQIGGLMSCRGGSFTNPGGSALSADGARIAGNALLDEGFAAEGEVRLAGMQAHVMRCRRGSFTNPSGSALSADGASVTGGVFLDEGFAAEGEVGLPGAQIGGVLRCSGGTFKNPSGSALVAEGARVTGGVFLGEGFAAEGEVLFSGAQVEGQFRCNGGVFTNPGGDAFEGRGMTVADRFIWLPRYRPEGMVSFRNARVHQLVDARETWPASRGIVLDGFSYDAIFCTPEDVGPAERIGWLCRNHRYSPQPYEQLAGFYRREGNEGAARQVAIAKQIARRQDGGLQWWQRVWSKFLGATVGYGYRPWLAVFWLLGIWLVGVALFNWGPDAHQVMQRLGGENSPRFSPWIYPLDAILPIINLRQRDFWLPNVAKPWGTWYATYVMAGMFAGWALTSAVVAALTGLIRKD